MERKRDREREVVRYIWISGDKRRTTEHLDPEVGTEWNILEGT